METSRSAHEKQRRQREKARIESIRRILQTIDPKLCEKGERNDVLEAALEVMMKLRKKIEASEVARRNSKSVTSLTASNTQYDAEAQSNRKRKRNSETPPISAVLRKPSLTPTDSSSNNSSLLLAADAQVTSSVFSETLHVALPVTSSETLLSHPNAPPLITVSSSSGAVLNHLNSLLSVPGNLNLPCGAVSFPVTSGGLPTMINVNTSSLNSTSLPGLLSLNHMNPFLLNPLSLHEPNPMPFLRPSFFTQYTAALSAFRAYSNFNSSSEAVLNLSLRNNFLPTDKQQLPLAIFQNGLKGSKE